MKSGSTCTIFWGDVSNGFAYENAMDPPSDLVVPASGLYSGVYSLQVRVGDRFLDRAVVRH